MTLSLWPEEYSPIRSGPVHMSRDAYSQREVQSACGNVVDIDTSNALTGDWRDVTCRSCQRTRWYQVARRRTHKNLPRMFAH